MAINPQESANKIIESTNSACSKSSNQGSRGLMNYLVDGSISSNNSKYDKFKAKKIFSPYLTEDRVEMMSRITEKRLVRKQTSDFVSSFPLAVNIYKASSDEFKALKKTKKVKKSVLTLPNNPAALPQPCTVSDMNESEYFDGIKDERKIKPKKRRAIKTNRKPRMNKAMELFDRDAEYCSRLNIDLDSSSTDMIHQFTGDEKKVSTKRRINKSKKSDTKPHDVWAMLRNMHRYPFRKSPPSSEDSRTPIKKNTYNKRQNGQMDAKFIETHTTEEFTFISNSFDNRSVHSQSSVDRITVIDKEDEYRAIHEELEVVKNIILPSKVKSQKNLKKFKAIPKTRQNSTKAICDVIENDNLFHKNNENHKIRNGLSKSFQNKAPSRCNSPDLEYTNNCIRNESNIFSSNINALYVSDHHLNVCGCSVSSNGDIIKNLADMTGTCDDTSNKMSTCGSRSQINGITKVVLSKGQNILSTNKDDSLPRRKLRSVITMPSSVLYPKLTQTDIRRRLANIKFPLVILGKDQCTSTPFRVATYDPPHLAPLSEHIWPFMQNWLKKDNNGIATSKKVNIFDKSTYDMKINGGDNNGRRSIILRNKNVIPPVPVPNIENYSKAPRTTKPMRQFKESIFKFIYKKSSDGDYKEYFPRELPKKREVYNRAVNVATNTQHNFVDPKENHEITSKLEDKIQKCISSNKKQLYPKTRWASDFIDNVIKKIRSGVYYTQDVKNLSRNDCRMTKEGSVQTEMSFTRNDFCKNSIQKSFPNIADVDHECDIDQKIPGFDDSLLDLQIETIDKNQIAVKHCVTNIIVQFDVATPSEINRVTHLTQSISCIPVSITENHTKLFKSKTTIVNAILPAEICTILPMTMRQIIDNKLLIPKLVDQVESELTHSERDGSIIQLLPVHNNLSPEMKILMKGNFAINVSTITTKRLCDETKIRQDSLHKLDTLKTSTVLPKIQINLLFNYEINPIASGIFESRFTQPKHDNDLVQPTKPRCMALQSYSLSNKQIVPAYNTFNLFDIIFSILSNPDFSIQLTMPLKDALNGSSLINNIEIITPGLDIERSKNWCVNFNAVDPLYTGFQGRLKDNKEYPTILYSNQTNQKLYTDQKCSHVSKFENYRRGFQYCVTYSRNKKRSFVKLYRKCKSMSNIFNEKSSVALSKVNNLDDFFLALGSAKSLASVFDGTTEKKILSSIREMKNWISDITSRQALLVLLLANKKDTANLMRYRPVILQGIAVKRITRASELDMEIEVIEKENLNTLSKYEGIAYVPASIENQESLLEELCWIAKTTASDYQKHFDKSSERLIKSLLEKRKKLSPSYLRVMARYVGLGLLKSPK